MLQAHRSRGIARWTRLIAAVACITPTFGLVRTASADAPTPPDGIWYTKDDESIIRVHPCVDDADSFCGTLVWLKEPNEANGQVKIDKLNRDPAKKNKPMIGLDILLQMKPDSDHWKGKAYNPDDGKIYDITFKVKTDKEANDTADLRGCVLSFLCQTETFTRAKEVPGGDPTLTADASAAKKGQHKAKKDLKSSAHR